jgi:hypothetical protein
MAALSGCNMKAQHRGVNTVCDATSLSVSYPSVPEMANDCAKKKSNDDIPSNCVKPTRIEAQVKQGERQQACDQNDNEETCNNLICSLSFSAASPRVCVWLKPTPTRLVLMQLRMRGEVFPFAARRHPPGQVFFQRQAGLRFGEAQNALAVQQLDEVELNFIAVNHKFMLP